MDLGRQGNQVARSVGWRDLGTFLLVAAGFLGAAPDVLAGTKDKPDEFRKGILAATANDWGDSARFMRLAHEKLKENGEFVRVGTRRMTYLPLYHLGLALYKEDKCQEALRVWKESTDLGFVTQDQEFSDLLVKYRRDCSNRR